MQSSSSLTCLVLIVHLDARGEHVLGRVSFPVDEIIAHHPDWLADGRPLRHAMAQAGTQAGGRGNGAPHRAAEPAFSPSDAVLIEEIYRQITQRLAEPCFNVEQIAHEMALSPRQLRRRVRALTGETPQHLLRRARVERAEMLLRCHTPSVKEVAHAVGYTTPEGLRRAFVAVRGIPPTAVHPT